MGLKHWKPWWLQNIGSHDGFKTWETGKLAKKTWKQLKPRFLCSLSNGPCPLSWRCNPMQVIVQQYKVHEAILVQLWVVVYQVIICFKPQQVVWNLRSNQFLLCLGFGKEKVILKISDHHKQKEGRYSSFDMQAFSQASNLPNHWAGLPPPTAARHQSCPTTFEIACCNQELGWVGCCSWCFLSLVFSFGWSQQLLHW